MEVGMDLGIAGFISGQNLHLDGGSHVGLV